MGVTDANVTFTNDLPTSLTVKKTSSTAMGKDLPDDQTIPALSTSSPQHIETSDWSLDQSAFTLNFNGETAAVNLGTGLYKTDASWSSNDGKIGGVLAPANFLTPGVDFNFMFFAGPGGWASYIDAYLRSNVEKFLNLLAAKPITVPLPGDIKVSLTKMEISSLDCSYASISNTGAQAPGHSGMFSATIIINTSLTASGSVSLLGGTLNSSGSLAVTNATALARVSVDLTKPKISAVLTTLATSVKDWSLSSDILDDLVKAFPPLGLILPEITNGYHLAACLNSEPVNGQIVGLINKMLKDLEGQGHALLASMMPLTDPKVVADLLQPMTMDAISPSHVTLE
ncbi:hypothetical protein PFICI_06280 [Pestalotiopsis fici W106-1]|uniref:Uncharacterized protein n=1 Tax=Pestalotiopsis fici (strain W106-1 / CGMCC3.15140) TaxID=1229662 RepID=W3X5A0_PESFW|nr:uncharacterized protein PFICI_06280 [Pestalotiopsis fici W106-1]ETS81278.1 hypothetical protein PFICI_06280 [Pestalotiopsis fici W106-1]